MPVVFKPQRKKAPDELQRLFCKLLQVSCKYRLCSKMREPDAYIARISEWDELAFSSDAAVDNQTDHNNHTYASAAGQDDYQQHPQEP